MRKLVAFGACALSAAAFAANMASQKWVEMKLDGLRNEIGVTKAVSPMEADAGTNGTLYAFFEPATIAALVATNSSNFVITNGATFAWNGNGVYTNAVIGAAVFATQTNFVYMGIGSSVVDGIDTFPGAVGFSVTGEYITETEAKKITGGAQ